MGNLADCKDADWIAAEAALDAARKLPPGPMRFEAIKRAGHLRRLASEKFIERDDEHALTVARLAKRAASDSP
jgi:hypothetical protein